MFNPEIRTWEIVLLKCEIGVKSVSSMSKGQSLAHRHRPEKGRFGASGDRGPFCFVPYIFPPSLYPDTVNQRLFLVFFELFVTVLP